MLAMRKATIPLTGQHTTISPKSCLWSPMRSRQGTKRHAPPESLITEPRVRVIAKYAGRMKPKLRELSCFSNRLDAIRVDDNDRRLFVVYNRKEPKEQAPTTVF